ncbi:MAG: hypothetical protein ACKOKC_17145 [Chthoniobacterales bacterium]
MRWWTFEDALRDRKGHWSEYLQNFRRGLEAEGDEVRIFADRECQPELAEALGAEPVLPKSMWARMSDRFAAQGAAVAGAKVAGEK